MIGKLISETMRNSPLFILYAELRKGTTLQKISGIVKFMISYLSLPERRSELEFYTRTEERDVDCLRRWFEFIFDDISSFIRNELYSFVKPYKTKEDILYDLIFPVYPTAFKGMCYIYRGMHQILFFNIFLYIVCFVGRVSSPNFQRYRPLAFDSDFNSPILVFSESFLYFLIDVSIELFYVALDFFCATLNGIKNVSLGIITIILSPLDLVRVPIRAFFTAIYYNRDFKSDTTHFPLEIRSKNESGDEVEQTISKDAFLYCILPYLNLQDLSNLTFVSKQCNNLVQDFLKQENMLKTYYDVLLCERPIWHSKEINARDISRIYSNTYLLPTGDRFPTSKQHLYFISRQDAYLFARSQLFKLHDFYFSKTLDVDVLYRKPQEKIAIIHKVDYFSKDHNHILVEAKNNQEKLRNTLLLKSPYCFFAGNAKYAKVSSSGQAFSLYRELEEIGATDIYSIQTNG